MVLNWVICFDIEHRKTIFFSVKLGWKLNDLSWDEVLIYVLFFVEILSFILFLFFSREYSGIKKDGKIKKLRLKDYDYNEHKNSKKHNKIRTHAKPS